MIEKIIVDYLNSLDALQAKAYTEVPKNVPDKYYLIEKTGASVDNWINTSTVAIQSHADTLYDVISLNEDLREAMLNGLITLDEISGVHLNSDYNFTDTTTKRHRYQAVYQVTHY